MAVTIWLATHASTEASDTGLTAGLTDSPLSALARGQACELRARYSPGTHDESHAASEARP